MIAELRKDDATLTRKVNALLTKSGVSHWTEVGQLSLFGNTSANNEPSEFVSEDPGREPLCPGLLSPDAQWRVKG